jgi:DNA invertase Pin-like site-specific DNA recombinase
MAEYARRPDAGCDGCFSLPSLNPKRVGCVHISRIMHKIIDIDFAQVILCILYVRNRREKMALLGYGRVSTDGQSLTAQVAELKAAGCIEIYQEKVSGTKADRKQLARLIGRLDKDDVLVVTRLDRLARSTRDLLNLLGAVADKGAGFKSLRDTWADTTTPHGRLMLTVLGGLAEFERELIRTRTGEGRERAKARGVILGRKPKLTGHQRREAIARREAGEVLTDIARFYNVSHSTISRL